MIKGVDALALLAYCGFIYYLSDQPSLSVPKLFSWQDKVEHFSAYAVMGFLAWRCFRHYVERIIILAILGFLFCSLYGGLDEYHQSFVAGRVADMTDWIADSLGGAFMLFLLHKRANKGLCFFDKF